MIGIGTFIGPQDSLFDLEFGFRFVNTDPAYFSSFSDSVLVLEKYWYNQILLALNFNL